MERGGGTLPITDFKSALQEAVQSLGLPQPLYVLVEEAGPEHSKTFTVEARLHNRDSRIPEFVGRAQGSTKKTAEQDAARQLLTYLASRPKETEGKAARSPQAVDLTKDNPDSPAGKAARQEQDRLMKYASTGTPTTTPKN